MDIFARIGFEQRGTPSNRTLKKIAKQVGDQPFELKKVNGEFIAEVKGRKDS